MSPGRVLVTGGAGFIGSHVCEAYLVQGWEVTALDNLDGGRAANVPRGVHLIEMDIRDEGVRRVFRDGGFDVVNHHAAQANVRDSVSRPRHDASVNVDGLLNLLECALEFGLSRFVFISSGGALYGEAAGFPIPRAAPKRPLSPYGVSKLASEHYLDAFRRLRGLEYVALRYANVYGPRQDPHGEAGVVAIFARRILDDERLVVFGDGEQTRDFVFVKDVAAANVLATNADLPRAGGLDDVAFNVGTGERTSINALATAMIEIAGRAVEIAREPARPGDPMHNGLDCSEIRALGWSPAHSLDAGLRETLDFIAREAA
ncbi:NAD-dependent epimerase/dehydratase family protein [Candidatus Palauibacter sp.]|uniref:NAD-dependent epimerase/dehydratase family protein n=1 Tax=Candidatus Palauibacter sp. TaxID=3101350 RepID=UPI003B010AE3